MGDTIIPTEAGDTNGNPNAANPTDDTTLIIGVAAGIGALFLIVLILFVIFVLYYYKKGDPEDDEDIYHSRASSRAGSRRGSRAGSRAGSRRGSRAGSRAGSLAGSTRASIIRSSSLRNSFHAEKVFLPSAGWSSVMSHNLVHGSLDNLNRNLSEKTPLRSSKNLSRVRSFQRLQKRMEAKSNPMSSSSLLPDSMYDIRGSQNKGFTSEYEDLDRDLWHASKGGEGTVTHNPTFGKDTDDFGPLDVNLEGFDKELGADQEDVDSGMADVTAAEETNDTTEAPTESNNESSKIQILDMNTWSSPPHSPNGMSQPTPFTISEQISQEADNRGDEINLDFTRANPLSLAASASDLNSASMKRRNQSVVDFYENANPRILGYSMDFPSDAYGTGRRLLWQKKHFDEK